MKMYVLNNVVDRYVRLALPKGNVRKWKFRIQTFREVEIVGQTCGGWRIVFFN
jgi:hypothetical protein